jgi:hypothetical protein
VLVLLLADCNDEMLQSEILYLPGDLEFDETLGRQLPPTISGQEWVYVARANSGILEAVSPETATEYLYGGEYDERIKEIDDGAEL